MGAALRHRRASTRCLWACWSLRWAAARGRLSQDRGLPRATVLRAITQNAAYELHQDEQTGSLEVGKLADLIVLDRNVLTVAPQDIARVKVLETVVAGREVYRASQPAAH